MIHFTPHARQRLGTRSFEPAHPQGRNLFIDRAGFELYTTDGLSLDEFDGSRAVYVCSRGFEGHVHGVARLLPTTHPYWLEKRYAQLWAKRELPHSPKVWELSRFAAVDFTPSASIHQQAKARHASQLLMEVVQTARQRGAHTLVTAAPIGMERLLHINGLHCHRVARPLQGATNSIVGLIIQLVHLSSHT